ncbi:MAG: S9 family peptidase [Bacteroidota bacterium]
MKRIVPFLLLLLPVLMFAQPKLPITHESLWLMKRVGAPVVSPDGKWVVFSVTEPAYDEKEAVNDLWMVPSDGSSPARRITANKAGESGYAWSPDSRQIAFVAKRDADEVAQIYLLNIKDGGEAQRLTNLSTGAGMPAWSPDGKSILFPGNVYPGAFTDSANKKVAEERKAIKYKARVYTSFPVREWDHWIDEKKTHFFIQDVNSGTANDILRGMDSASERNLLISGSACWSADGKSIIFSGITEGSTRAWQDVPTSLFKADLQSGKVSFLTRDSLNSFTSPQVSADGKYLYCLQTAERNYKVFNSSNLVRFNWPSLTGKVVLGSNVDRTLNSFKISAAGILMSIEDQARDKLYLIPAGDTKAQLVSDEINGCYTSPSVSDDGNVIVAAFETAAKPAEIVRVKKGMATSLTSFNEAKVKALDLGAIEDVWFTSSRGKKIHSLLVKPANFDPAKKYPLFVVMHGGPAGAWKYNWGYRWNYHLLAKPGYVLLLTNYTGSTGFGEKFGQDIQYDPFKGPADEINEAAADAIKRFAFIDGTKQAAGGASYGGHLANWLEATTTHYKCLIAHAGLVNSEVQWGTSDGIYTREVMNGGTPWQMTKTFTEQNPIRYAAKFKTPMLVTVGEQDFRVPLNNSLENWSALQRMKVPSKLIVFPDENHWILKAENSRFFYQQLHDWLATYLK